MQPFANQFQILRKIRMPFRIHKSSKLKGSAQESGLGIVDAKDTDVLMFT
jgi:hypothetical protein